MSDSGWQVTIPCNRADAETLNEDWDFLGTLSSMPTIVSEELEAFNNDKWQITAYFNEKPSRDNIAALHAYLPSAAHAKPILEELADQDWLVMSQQELAPVQAGQFYVHTPDNANDIPKNAKAFVIPASQAFGTGGHETTYGCLKMLDSLNIEGRHYRKVADIGTGTGLLAFAAMHLWPNAYYTASDIDPVSIEVTHRNANDNNIKLGRARGMLATCVASGTDNAMIRNRAPYNLLIANILAGPLMELAPSLAAVMAPNGTLILAGLLDTQADKLISVYRRNGFRLEDRQDNGDWPCLRFTLRNRYGHRRSKRASGHTSQKQGDTGEW